MPRTGGVGCSQIPLPLPGAPSTALTSRECENHRTGVRPESSNSLSSQPLAAVRMKKRKESSLLISRYPPKQQLWSATALSLVYFARLPETIRTPLRRLKIRLPGRHSKKEFVTHRFRLGFMPNWMPRKSRTTLRIENLSASRAPIQFWHVSLQAYSSLHLGVSCVLFKS